MLRKLHCFGQRSAGKTLALLLSTLALLWQQSFQQGASQVIIATTDCDTSFAIFSLVQATSNFAQAREFCESNGLGTLARISSQEEYDAVLALRQSVNQFSSFWIGAVDTSNDTGPESYVFLDGSEEGLDFLHSGIGVFPWGWNEPNNEIEGGEKEDCVEWRPVHFDLWNDNQCSKKNSFLCRASCPTHLPIQPPTQSPIRSPIKSPTQSPTIATSDEKDIEDKIVSLPVFSGLISVLLLCFISTFMMLRKEKNEVKRIEQLLLGMRRTLVSSSPLLVLPVEASTQNRTFDEMSL